MEEQCGFPLGSFTITCDLVLNNFVFNAFKHYSQIYVIYINFKKAFYKVDNTVLMQILEASVFGMPLLYSCFDLNHILIIEFSGSKYLTSIKLFP